MVYDAGFPSIYINGQHVASSGASLNWPGGALGIGGYWHIGTNPGEEIPLNGCLDEVAVFKKALNATTIANLYAQGTDYVTD